MHLNNTIIPALGIALLLGVAAAPETHAQDNNGWSGIEVVEPGDTGRRVDEDGVFGNYFPTAGSDSGQSPAVLLLGGSEGGLGRGALQMAQDLQREGFSVFHQSYFGAPGQPEALERIPLEVFDRGLDWLKAQPEVDPSNIAVLGASKGAEAALLVASRRSDLRAVVAGMPTSVVWNGINWANGGASFVSSWTASGEDMTTMPYAMWNPSEGIISVYRSIEDPERTREARNAAIPIEQSAAEVMLVCGEDETMWPACPMSRMLAERSADHQGPPVTVLAYDDAGHFVFGPPVAEESPFYPQLGAFGGTVEGNAAARADSWPRVVEFLRSAGAGR
jgi:dienelactone hydrolase